MNPATTDGWTVPGPRERCPCLSGNSYGECCGRYLGEEMAYPAVAYPAVAYPPTAEALMRSRFTAFATGNAGYLKRTWHPDTRPAELDLDPSQRWYRLDILGTQRGGPLDDQGIVTFRAYYRHDGTADRLEETSRFVRLGKQWLYVDALEIS